MPEAKQKAEDKTADEANFSTDFSNLNDDLQSQIREYQTKGWTITKSPEGFNAEVQYGLKSDKTVFTEIQSIDALFAAIEKEEKEYLELVADQEPAEEIFTRRQFSTYSGFESSADLMHRMSFLKADKPTVKREVRVKLTKEELDAYVIEETANRAVLKKIVSDEKNYKAEIKARTKEYNENKARIEEAIDTREETREVECYEDFDVKNRIVKFIRRDTLEYDGSRPMNDKERQRHLPLI